MMRIFFKSEKLINIYIFARKFEGNPILKRKKTPSNKNNFYIGEKERKHAKSQAYQAKNC